VEEIPAALVANGGEEVERGNAMIGGMAYRLEGKTIQSQYDRVLSCISKFLQLYGKDAAFQVQLNPAFQAVADKLKRQGIDAITSDKVLPPLHFYVCEQKGEA
jgi:hypothetical protein